MHPPINPVDDGERRAAELVIKPAGYETADHGFAMAFAFERPGKWRALCAVFCKALVQPLDDIAALPKRTQAWFRILGKNPSRRSRLAQQAPIARASASDQSGVSRNGSRAVSRSGRRSTTPSAPLASRAIT